MKIMIRFYMYVIYRLYDFFSKKDTTPIGDTVIVMSVIHFIQVCTLFLYIDILLDTDILPDLKMLFTPKTLSSYLVIFFIYILYYFIVFHNGKWKEWAEQFKKETHEDRKKNGMKVWLFCWGSIILFFISLLIISFLK